MNLKKFSTIYKLAAVISVITIIQIVIILFAESKTIQLPAVLIGSIIIIFTLTKLLKPLKVVVAEIKEVSAQKLHDRFIPQEVDELSFLTASFAHLINLSEDMARKINFDNDLLISEKNKLQTIVDSIPNAVLVLDMHRQVMIVNKAALELTGYEPHELIGKSIDRLILIKEKITGREITPKEYCPIDLSGHGLVASYKNLNIAILTGKNNKFAEIRILSSPVVQTARANLGCIVIIQDSSKEQQLESMQLDFVSLASHELRTPITSIIGYLNVLIDEGREQFSKDQLDFLERILVSAQQISSLINNLLSVSKVEKGTLSITTQPIDLEKLLARTVENNQPQAAQKNLSLDYIYSKEKLPMVSGDNIYITEIIDNLITNAIKYTSGGGWIRIQAKAQDKEIIISVADNGVGIPKEAIPNLFAKFFRVQSALDKSSNTKGTGLGLYISKSIVEVLKGKIWVESEIGKGSTFYVSLPVATERKSQITLTNPNTSSRAYTQSVP